MARPEKRFTHAAASDAAGSAGGVLRFATGSRIARGSAGAGDGSGSGRGARPHRRMDRDDLARGWPGTLGENERHRQLSRWHLIQEFPDKLAAEYGVPFL
jgi:hypothetical protein